MPITDSRELLSLLLEGKCILEPDFDAFVKGHPKEDQWFDYKDGLLTSPTQRESGKQTIREWVSSFANADGGTLIVGVDETKPVRQVSGCHNVGDALDVWAEKLLRDMAGFFSPPPRFQVLRHSKGEVLLVAVARAPQLVPCITSRQWKYFLRVNDSTFEVPPYLISDLVLGRRSHPILDLSIGSALIEMRQRQVNGRNVWLLEPRLNFMIENLSLVAARNVEIGFVGWMLSAHSVTTNRYLLGFVDTGAPPKVSCNPLGWCVGHIPWRDNIMRPLDLIPAFDRREVPDTRGLALPVEEGCTYLCAVYVMPEGSPPTWFQLVLGTDGDWVDKEKQLRPQKCSLTRVTAGRPRLSFECTTPSP